MLSHLHIENFALIDLLDIDFGEGLNVLTGSTGAGKSIIVGALDLILGGRGGEEIIRTGEAACVVEADFKLESAELAKSIESRFDISLDGRTITVRREYRRKGGGRAFIEGSQVSLSELKELSEHLADILGQHSHQALLDPATHCGYLDRFAGLEKQVSELRSLYNKSVNLRNDLQASDRIAREISDRIDLLSFQINEIERADLSSGEEEKLKDEKKLLENSQKIRETVQQASRLLLEDDGSAIERIGEAVKSLGAVAPASGAVKEITGLLGTVSDSLRDSVNALQNLASRLDDDPQRLEEVNLRLDEIYRLKKKYGANINEILEYAEKSRAELASLKTRQTDTRNLRERLDKSVKELNDLAHQVSAQRKKAAPSLEKLVMEKLVLMGIPKAQFRIENGTAQGSDDSFYKFEDKPLAGDATGFDVVEFQFCANPGEGLKPLARIASGGEISRVMLALKNAFLSYGPTGRRRGGACEIFDEIDVGISGDVAAKVARQLKELSKRQQVICITHLAQIASLGDSHFKVFKSPQRGRSVTRVQLLDQKERIKEIASLISGEKISPKAIAGAEELLRNGGQDK
jgi:DNA repair protein RecN (Recombination protein N)